MMSGGQLNETRGVMLCQAAEKDPSSVGCTNQLRERLFKRMLSSQFDIAVRREHEQPRAADLSGGELQHQQRWLVGPVEVVENEDQRPARARPPEEHHEAIEQPKAGLLGFEARGRRHIAELGANLR